MNKIKGFSIIEALMSLVIIGIGITAVLQMLKNSSNLMVNSQERVHGVNAARDLMEDKYFDFNSSVTGSEVSVPITSGELKKQNPTRSYNVYQGTGNSYNVVEVKVEW